MQSGCRRTRTVSGVALLLTSVICAGCHLLPKSISNCPECSDNSAKASDAIPGADLPRELARTTMPTYVIEPPDILVIDALRVVPIPPYRIEPQDYLLIRVAGVPPEAPIDGLFIVNPDGSVNLGVTHGIVYLDGLTLEEAKKAIEDHLKKMGVLKPSAIVSLAQTQAVQQIRGEHLVLQDGTISLGVYGSVYVTGLTIQEARAAIEKHLAQYLVRPKVAVDVLAFNSKVYYVITDGAGFGQQLTRLAITGNETVLDAISNVNGLAPQASKCHIWVARPSPQNSAYRQVLPVDWNAIVEGGQTDTNYQVLPGDRIYLKGDPLIAFDNWLNKILTPTERVFGGLLLGSEAIQSARGRTGGTGGTGIP